jgi:hypothetical protein
MYPARSRTDCISLTSAGESSTIRILVKTDKPHPWYPKTSTAIAQPSWMDGGGISGNQQVIYYQKISDNKDVASHDAMIV